jgi:hypothetical protein
VKPHNHDPFLLNLTHTTVEGFARRFTARSAGIGTTDDAWPGSDSYERQWSTGSETVYKRALQLGRQLGEETHLFPMLFGLRSFHLIRGELDPAYDLAQQLVGLARVCKTAVFWRKLTSCEEIYCSFSAS